MERMRKKEKKSEYLKEYHKEYYKRNREKIIKRATEYNKTHRDRVRETSRAYEMRRVEKLKQLEEENKKLKSDLSECECSMLFENDEVGYRKRECKKLKETIKDHQLYEEKLEHRIIEFEELLHGE